MVNLRVRMRFVFVFAWFYGWSSVKRGVTWVLSYLALPLATLFMIYMISRGMLLDYALVGGTLAMVTANALGALGDTAFFRLETRLQDLLVAANVSPLEYLLGIGFGNLIYSFPGLALFIVLIAVFRAITSPLGWGLLILSILVLPVGASGLAFLGGSRISHMRNSWGIAALVMIFLTLLPPLYYPYWLLPKYALYALMISPATPASVVIQQVMAGNPPSALALALLLLENLAYAMLGLSMGRWED